MVEFLDAGKKNWSVPAEFRRQAQPWLRPAADTNRLVLLPGQRRQGFPDGKVNGYYSNVSQGRRKKAGQDGLVPCILQPEESSKAYRKNWARLARLWRVR